MSLDILISSAEKIANQNTDGHLTILKFTTGWKVFLGTPNLDIGEERDKISNMKSFQTLKLALENFITNQPSIWSDE